MIRRTLLSFLPALLLAATSAHAASVFSNLGEGNSFGSGAWTIEGPTSPDHDALLEAASFTVGANAYTFDSAELALNVTHGNNVMNVWLYSNAPGSPGSQLASSSITGIPSGGALLTANFGGTYTLQANTTYWLVAGASNDTYGGWFMNNTEALGQANMFVSSPPWYVDTTSASAAFRINGTLVPPTGPAASAVPLPSAVAAVMALLPLGLVAKLRRRVRG